MDEAECTRSEAITKICVPTEITRTSYVAPDVTTIDAPIAMRIGSLAALAGANDKATSHGVQIGQAKRRLPTATLVRRPKCSH